MKNLVSSLKLIVLTLFVCSLAYPLVVLAVARTVTPDSASGSLVTDGDGRVVGSRFIAQPFNTPRYFWPRPSAADFNASAAGGSNLAPSSPALAERAAAQAARFGASPANPLPADLAAASGSGLDPHISEAAAKFQAARVAAARGLPPEKVEAVIETLAFQPGGWWAGARVVNILELNLALDRLE